MNFKQIIALSLVQIVCKLRNGEKLNCAIWLHHAEHVQYSLLNTHTNIAGLGGPAFNTLYIHTLSLTESRTGPSPLPNINVNRGPRPGNHVADSSR